MSTQSGCKKIGIIKGTGRSNPLIFQTWIIWSNIIHSLRYVRSTTLDYKDIGIRKSEFVGKNSVPLWDNQKIVFTNRNINFTTW